MQITLPKEKEQFIESEVAAGHVGSSDDVIIEALDLYQVRQQYMEERIKKGIEDIRAGRSEPYSPKFLEDITQGALAKLANKNAQ
jgi:Arc/MetJ-type ribon-helix-helix transcriptional regulator